MRTIISKAVFAATVATVGLGGAAFADTAKPGDIQDDNGRIEAGYLNCKYTDGSSIIVASERTFDCTYESAGSDRPVEKYTATISNYGVDLMITDSKTLRWAVLAPATADSTKGSLEGNYGGISADAAVGYGVGADVLVGGLEDSVALQPVALSTGSGLGAALGYESVTLNYEGTSS